MLRRYWRTADAVSCSRSTVTLIMLTITIDTNHAENALHDALFAWARAQKDANAIQVMRKRLDLGDVAMTALQQQQATLVIERKSWSDWSASIADGRYREQKTRFAQSAENSDQFIYLIEGAIVPMRDTATRGIPTKAVVAAMLKTQLRDQITVIRTADKQDTCDTLTYVARQLASNTLERATVTHDEAISQSHKRKRSKLDNDPLLVHRRCSR